jgi:hypothetical protein
LFQASNSKRGFLHKTSKRGIRDFIVNSAGLATNLQGTLDSSNVDTTQIASTALEALGLDPNTLTGVVLEGTQSLPTTGLIPNPAVPEPTSILGTITALCLGFGLKRHNSKK